MYSMHFCISKFLPKCTNIRSLAADGENWKNHVNEIKLGGDIFNNSAR